MKKFNTLLTYVSSNRTLVDYSWLLGFVLCVSGMGGLSRGNFLSLVGANDICITCRVCHPLCHLNS